MCPDWGESSSLTREVTKPKLFIPRPTHNHVQDEGQGGPGHMAKKPFAEMPAAITALGAMIDNGNLPCVHGHGFTYEVKREEGKQWETHTLSVDMACWQAPAKGRMVGLIFECDNIAFAKESFVRLKEVEHLPRQVKREDADVIIFAAKTTFGTNVLRVGAREGLVKGKSERASARRKDKRFERRMRRWGTPRHYALA